MTMHLLDSRMQVPLGDARLVPLASPERLMMKAQASGVPLRRLRTPRMPSPAVQLSERALWGPHPDPVVAWIEEEFYAGGAGFLSRLFGAVMGEANPPGLFLKADPPRVPGWGDLAAMFATRAPLPQALGAWDEVLARLMGAIIPPSSIEATARLLALRSTLRAQIHDRVRAIMDGASWDSYYRVRPARQQAVLDATAGRGALYLTNLADSTKAAVRSVLVEQHQAGANAHDLRRVLFDRFAVLNRDWRRVALTETAMGVNAGILAAHDPAEGWLAEWSAIAGACPFCSAMNRRRFVLRADPAPGETPDWDLEVWPTKNNVGRSAHARTRDGRLREPHERWKPCIPAHPHCACGWIMRRRRG